jgi:aspartate/methionine/tyrosine aminotransferase
VSKVHASAKSSSFTESVIREMTRLAAVHDAINLGQGYPDFPAPEEVKEAARRAIAEDHNQYPITWGDTTFRRAIAAKYEADYGMTVDPETEICVTCGSTEAMAASFLGILDEGDEVVVFEPFYESYNPDAILSGATGRYVTLYPPDWRFDPDELAEAFGPRTRAIVVNSPHNPTGKVFTAEELGTIAGLCREYDAIAITDEIYEHITYEDREHVPIATLPGMRERTVTISALSKTYSVTGWRVGWAVAPPPLMAGIRSTHDFLTVAAAAPLQLAGIAALGLPGEYYQQIRKEYAERRDVMLEVLAAAGRPPTRHASP